MRAVITMLFIVFIGAGFLLSENLHMREDIDTIIMQNNQLQEENRSLQADVNETKENLATCDSLNYELAQKNLVLEKQTQELYTDVSELRAQNKDLLDAVNNLQAIRLFQQTTPNSLHLAYLLPIFPASIAVTYFFIRKRNKQDYKANAKKTDRRRIEVQLTNDEIQKLIRIRRNQKTNNC